jgi:Mg-chelatase subunit ChlD
MTEDVIDDCLDEYSEWAMCTTTTGGSVEHKYQGIYVDFDGDGVPDTMPVIFNWEGETMITAQPEAELGPGKWVSFSYKKRYGCPGSDDEKGTTVIRFVDLRASGFNYLDVNTWVYKAIKTVALNTKHGLSNNGRATPLLSVVARKQIGPPNNVDDCVTYPSPDWTKHQFSDEQGIKEVVLTSDFDDNYIDELILSDVYVPCVEVNDPSVVLLVDTSGSMSWSPTGDMSAPINEQRIELAKRATTPFLQLLEDYAYEVAKIGIATFPAHPTNPTNRCQGQIIMPLELVNSLSISNAINAIDDLTTENSTPLIAGIRTAMSMLSQATNKVIVLLSDGYHNCPSFVNPGDSQVTQIINDLAAQSIKVYTIGFGRPSDYDHPLLETLATETGGTFYDVTDDSFVSTDWDPATGLQVAYKSILVDGLGLDPIVDPYENNNTKNQALQI